MGQPTTRDPRKPPESGAGRGVRGGHPAAPRPILLLGRGGMGRVELAVERGPGQTRRLVAVKRLLAELVGDPDKRALFHREVTLAKRLEHPNVVRTRGSGEEDGEPFLVMDFVDGVPLDRLLAGAGDPLDRALPRELAAYVVGRVALGLHAAHELRDEGGAPLNLVHRDVSPHNVMVSREGDVLLLDFGVAKVDAEGALTKTGDVRGKTAYMSPEQGLGEPLDRRSDLFALGAVLFECVEGERMWGEGTELDVLRRLALDSPPTLPGDDALVDLHARMVARERAERPATAEEVARALGRFAETADVDDSVARARLAERVERIAGDDLRARADVIGQALGALGADARVVEMPASTRRGAEATPPHGLAARTWGRTLGVVALAALMGGAVLGALRVRADARAGVPAETTSSTGEERRPPSALPAAVSPRASSTSVDPPHEPHALASGAPAASPSSPSSSAFAGGRVLAHPLTKPSPSAPSPASSASSPAAAPPIPPNKPALNVDPTPF
ncbi:MAG: serine/threonine protein kinase [Myxococcales bacterium]|nr:serine/threonine protein kinase [Myxococcales bacterium]